LVQERGKRHVITGQSLLLSLLATAAQAQPPAGQVPLPQAQAPAEAVAQVPADEPAEPEDPLDVEEGQEEGEEIVVTGRRLPGAVVGDIPPEIVLDRRDIRAYGASSLAELLDALAPQTRSGRGRGEGRPVVLLNGRRISGFAEIRDIPPEAIQRVDILPEEVALKYGYRADQRVVNFVTRRRFRAVTAEADYGIATGGGRSRYGADVNYLRIRRDQRLSLDAEYRHQGALLESERDLVRPGTAIDIGEFRTLLPENDQLSLAGTYSQNILGDVGATVNARFDATDTRSTFGLQSSEPTPLTRDAETRTGHLGVTLNGNIAPWRWTFTGNYDRSTNFVQTDVDGSPRDSSRSTAESADGELVAIGSLFDLPAGDVSSTFRLGVGTRGFRSRSVRGGIEREGNLSRNRAAAQANIDLPIASRRRDVFSAIGDLSANFNAEVEQLSDFGTLTTIGYGLNWSPIAQVRLIASVTDEDGAPTIQQLGDPAQLTPNVRVFDFLRGETVDISRLDGGNPDLLADNRRVMKLGLNVKPFEETDITLSADYTNSRIRNPIASFPTATPEIEAAFPDRFVRDASGRLLSIDSRPTNFARADREELRWGINFTKPLSSNAPPERFGRRARERASAAAGTAPGTAPPSGTRPGGTATPAVDPAVAARQAAREARRRERGAGQGRGGFGGGRFGGGRGGRLQLALYHTWRLEDRILIREGLPELDLLDGSAIGSNGGRSRHELELQAGIFKNGLGARLSANWQSGTTVRGGLLPGGGTASDLSFSSLATFNLRLFANLGEQRALVARYPWLRGTRVSLVVDNLFDSRQRVRDEFGETPFSYQPDFLDPLGRSVRISVRKLFF